MNYQDHQVYHHSRADGLLYPLRALVHHPRLWLSKYLRSDDHVLDLGCGAGFFSLRIARMLDSKGHVTAADAQPEMLEKLAEQSCAQGLHEKITTHLQPSSERIGVAGLFDIILAFYMLHEVNDRLGYLEQIQALLPPHGIFLLMEPRFVLSPEEYDLEVKQAKRLGLIPVVHPKIFLSFATLFSPA